MKLICNTAMRPTLLIRSAALRYVTQMVTGDGEARTAGGRSPP